ncbi:MAG: hypothetical protein CSYNP_01164 [Syntrophus sp. SKADARSKE-3]|nr:hypothetical protein [Syntrophus sp. SKADARSKE-3]
MKERRKFERFTIDTPFRIEILDTERRGEILNLESENLSAGGICFRSPILLPIGARVKVGLVLQFDELQTTQDPDGALIITVTGQTVRSGPEGTTICFSDDYDVVTSSEIRENSQSESNQETMEDKPDQGIKG